MPRFSFFVMTNPNEGNDAEFNTWYDGDHLRDVLDIPGFVSARRFRVIESRSRSDQLPTWRYAAIYEMECDDPQTALQQIRERAGTPRMTISDALDLSTVATFLLQPIGDDRAGATASGSHA